MSTGLQQRVSVQLRWRDMDMLGHLNQSVYHELTDAERAARLDRSTSAGELAENR
jgi:acyl-CoA thioesterase FadM